MFNWNSTEFAWKSICGKCRVCAGSSYAISVRYCLCGFCKDILTPEAIKEWRERIAKEHGVCY